LEQGIETFLIFFLLSQLFNLTRSLFELNSFIHSFLISIKTILCYHRLR